MNSEQLNNAIATQAPISFYNHSSHQSPTVVCLKRPDGTVSFELNAKSRLRTNKRGLCSFNGANGIWTRFTIVDLVDGMIPSMMLYANKSERWLTVDAQGQFTSSEQPEVLHLTTSPIAPIQQPTIPNGTTPPTAPVDESILSTQQLSSFETDGFIILRNAVPRALVHDCLRSINKDLGQQQTELQLPPDLGRQVMNSSPQFWSALNMLLGKGNVKPKAIGTGGPQVALRFPGNRGKPVNGSQYHIDGMNSVDGVCGFTLLCGVALSDQSTPDKGNLHVYPGSHLHRPLRQFYVAHAGEADAAQRADKPYVGEPVQVLLNAGDVVIAHQMLAHAVGQNAGHDIRYQLYYRVSHASRHKHTIKQRITDEPWMEYKDGAIFKRRKCM